MIKREEIQITRILQRGEKNGNHYRRDVAGDGGEGGTRRSFRRPPAIKRREERGKGDAVRIDEFRTKKKGKRS